MDRVEAVLLQLVDESGHPLAVRVAVQMVESHLSQDIGAEFAAEGGAVA